MSTEIPVTDPSVTKLTPATITGNELIPLDDGTQTAAQAVTIENLTQYVSNFVVNADFQNPVYVSGKLMSYESGGQEYELTYSGDKIATVTGGGFVQTFTWSGDELVSKIVTEI